ncbi:hypothetical protein TELCIR_06890, partial [Teladorsagia circumcincta]
EKLQEERDDAVFELQRATHRIAALEEERNDYAERAEAASSEARDMARHNKVLAIESLELREQLHELEAELVASRTNSNIANRGNSMFAEARAANAETLMGYANDDIETLKIQLAMFREREQKKDAEKVSSLINGGSGDIEAECPIIPPPKLTATPIEKQAQTPAGRQSSREEPFTPFATSKTPVCATGEPSFYQDEHR